MSHNIVMLNVILASKSPRRRQILNEFRYKFSVVSVQTSEIFDENLSLNDALCEISKAKVLACLSDLDQSVVSQSLIIGCDTIVSYKGQVVGKPASELKAFEILKSLSGTIHEVKTSVSLFNGTDKTWCNFVETSKVKMKLLSDKIIKDYILTGEPMDKAGAYGIQGLGRDLVDFHEGSWYNIVGFPIEKFENVLNKKGWASDVDRV